jgi:Tfp pilus assembly protein PilO
MNNLQKRNSIVAAVLIITSIALYNWFVTPHTNYLMAEQQYQRAMTTIEIKNKLLSSELAVINKKLENLNKNYQQRKQMFFTETQAKDFLAGIQTSAEKNACTIENLRFIPCRDVKTASNDIGIVQYQTNLNVTGGYGNIVKFLNTIQSRPEKVQFDSLNIAMNNQTGYLDCGITMSIYTLNVKENIQNVSTK